MFAILKSMRGMTEIRSIAKYYKIGWKDPPPHHRSSHDDVELH